MVCAVLERSERMALIIYGEVHCACLFLVSLSFKTICVSRFLEEFTSVLASLFNNKRVIKQRLSILFLQISEKIIQWIQFLVLLCFKAINEAMRLETILYLCKEFFLGKIHYTENKEVQQYWNIMHIHVKNINYWTRCINYSPSSRKRPPRKFEKVVIIRAGHLREWAVVSDCVVKQ